MNSFEPLESIEILYTGAYRTSFRVDRGFQDLNYRWSQSPALTHSGYSSYSGTSCIPFPMGNDSAIAPTGPTPEPFSSVDDYVSKLEGTHPIKRVLIANNGIAAVKAIRSIRRFAYETFGNEREIHFTVMTTADDIKANAEYIRMADEFVEVPGGANNNNYANVQRIIETAEAVHADAVWAGWGHASENPLLPETLSKTGKIAFIGPDGRAMRALGDKIGSTIIAQSAGVPTIGWNADDVRVNYKETGLSQRVLDNASVKSVEEAMEVAEKIGYPLMIKASEGGGGKGIRKVTSVAQVKDAFRQVQAELPGSPIFIMKLVNNARHLEVQLLADKYGEAIALSGRDCSVQRRHQKIIEEGPVLAAPQSVLRQMEAAAVSLAKEVDYCNAGTVEYLFQDSDDSFAFLELNPRLQVEHPVTEMISGVNLPACQLQVAMGIPMHRIPDIRRLYGQSLLGTSRIDFGNEKQQMPGGHVIASRITAENPDSGFQPTSGAVTEVNFRSTPDVWGYFSVDSSGRVHEYADSQIGHLFSWGQNREIARRNMCLALKELSIRGDIRTTTEYLIGMMETEDFRQNRISTEWLDRRISENIQTDKPRPLLVAVIGAVVRGYRAIQARVNDYVDCLERGQTPSSDLVSVDEDVELIYDNVKYEMRTTLSGPNTVTVTVNGSYIQIDLRVLSDGGMLILLDGKSHLTYATEEATGLRLLLNGATCMFSKEYDPTQLRVSMSGKLSRYLVDDQQHVEANQAYAEIEVMKMYMQLVAPESGTMSLIKPEGSILEPGELLATVELDDPGKVRRSERFSGTLPTQWDAKAATGDFGSGDSFGAVNAVTGYRKANTVARSAINILEAALDGYKVPDARVKDALMERDLAFCNPHLPLLEFEELLFVLSSRLPTELSRKLTKLVSDHKANLKGKTFQQSHKKVFPRHPTELDLTAVKHMLNETATSMQQKERDVFQSVVQPLYDLIEKYSNGVAGANRKCLVDLVKRFLNVETLWGGTKSESQNYDDTPLLSGRANATDREGKQDEDVIAQLRTAFSGKGNCDDSTDARAFFGDEPSDSSLRRVYSLCRAHHHLKSRSKVLIEILDRIFYEIDALKACKLHEKSVRKRGDSYFTENSLETDFFDRQETGSPLTGYEEEERALHDLAELRGVQYAEVTLEARQILIRAQQPSTTERMVSVEKVLRQTNLSRESYLNSGDDGASPVGDEVASKADPLISLLNYEQPMIDILFAYFAHPEMALRKCALEVYVRRLYRAYEIQNLEVKDSEQVSPGDAPMLLAKWFFSSNSQRSRSSVANVSSETRGQYGSYGSNFAGITPTDSFDDLASVSSQRSRRSASSVARRSVSGPHVEGVSPKDQRIGVIAVLANIEQIEKSLETTLAAFKSSAVSSTSEEPRHVLHFGLLERPSMDLDSADEVSTSEGDSKVAQYLQNFMEPFKRKLKDAGVRRITFLIPNIGQGVKQNSKGLNADTGGRMVNLFDESDWEVLPPLDKVKGRYEQGLKLSAIAASFYSCSQALGQNIDLYSVGVSEGEGSSAPWQLVGFPRIYTLRSAEDFAEDSTVRHIEPPLSGYLELRRLRNFNVRLVPTPNRSIHVYEAVPKPDRGKQELARGVPRKRYFVRAIVRQTARLSTLSAVEEQFPGPERMFVDALDALDIAMGDSLQNTRTPVGGNHIFLNVLPTAQVHPEYVESVIRRLAKRYSERLRRSRVSQVEFKVNAQFKVGGPIVPVRLVSSNPTGYVLRVDTYVETQPHAGGHSTPIFTAVPSTKMFLEESTTDTGDVEGPYGQSHLPPLPGSKESMLGSILRHGQLPTQSGMWSEGRGSERERSHVASEQKGELDGKPISTPYPVATAFEAKRALAAAISDTLWCYDFIELFERALEQKWYRYEKQRRSDVSNASHPTVRRPQQILKATELVLKKTGGTNKYQRERKQADSSSVASSPGMKRNYSDIFANEMGAPPATSGRRVANNSNGKETIQEVDESADSTPKSPIEGKKSFAGNVSVNSESEDIDHSEYELVLEDRPPGENDIGMVAWHVKLFTPTHPEESGGRDLVIIANDITHRAGSFGTKEDRLFRLATEYARQLGIPRIYLAANSGARIGLAEEVKSCFRVEWIDRNDPSKGYKYLYLSEDDYERLSKQNSVNAARHETPDGEVHYVIQDIIGKEPDLGVENLRGSGTIAGETAKAYHDIFTLTYVTGRSVGIGAYLVRLGQRVIQKSGSAPILLTGYQALNKLIGNQVYTSNLQLGGPKVMYSNGVSHEVVNDDLDGIISILNWLSFIPKSNNSSLPISAMPPGETVERPIDVFPPKDSTMDPRYLLTGVKEPLSTESPDGSKFRGGFFDKNSFVESLSGWARTVIVGRARLGGIPMGTIIPETRTVSSTIPADPAMPSSHETVTTQAGQVWYPDSAFKTSQAIQDFNREGLPLMIFANWRGFSGGQRDMFDQVLKFGSYIVDALVNYKHPVFVYIPPLGELRGGAWVVVDPTINQTNMEMYSEPTGRGGVLEPSGAASIKFRESDIKATAHRLDSKLRDLDSKLDEASKNNQKDEISRIKQEINKREQLLQSTYLQISHSFADLHDTPGRMHSKGVIRDIIPWERARSFFYWRLRRRMAEFALNDRLLRAAPQLKSHQATDIIKMWFSQHIMSTGGNASALWENDTSVLRWLANSRDVLEMRARELQRESVSEQVLELGTQDPYAVVSGILAMLQHLPADKKEATLGALRRAVLFDDSSHNPFGSSGIQQARGESNFMAQQRDIGSYSLGESPYNYYSRPPAPPGQSQDLRDNLYMGFSSQGNVEASSRSVESRDSSDKIVF
eukprot:gb/GECG01000434.1/.p1 GENE.gb/GECG01000434.1/~~gb/GECG01000434.1/.p1  ORF type:complete len:2813 (+),score=333.03 gb/GECG01000434.1/:1-8439(+)